jgi:hypothetical protein
MLRRWCGMLGLLVAGVLPACTSSLSRSGAGAGPEGQGPGDLPGSPPGGEPSAEPPLIDPAALAPRLPLRLLTSEQYAASLRLILDETYGVLPQPLSVAKVLPGQTRDASGFYVTGAVDELAVLRYLDVAASVASSVAPMLPKLLGCDIAALPAAPARSCIERFTSEFGELLYRRPLTASELREHLAFYDHELGVLKKPTDGAALALLQAMLMSPHFLYRWEQGEALGARDGAVVRLNAYQVASRLSFLFWGSGPDRELIALARSGGLATEALVSAKARSMLASPRAAGALESFHSQWLRLGRLDELFKDPVRFPAWTPALRADLRAEIQAFTRHVILEGDATLSALLSAPYSFLNEPLAGIYSVAGVTGPELRRVELDPSQRAGLLTLPGLLAAASDPSVQNPFRRGQLLLEQLLCQKLEPPPQVPALPPKDTANPRPEREVLEELTQPAACAGCHAQLNPLGFGLSNFDAIGAYHSQDEGGFAIDASGRLPSGESFSGPSELARALAASDAVATCVMHQWFRFGTGRVEASVDSASLQGVKEAWLGSGSSVRELLVAIASSRSFLYRALDEGEVMP